MLKLPLHTPVEMSELAEVVFSAWCESQVGLLTILAEVSCLSSVPPGRHHGSNGNWPHPLLCPLQFVIH